MREACDLIVKGVAGLMEAVRSCAPTSTGARR